MWSNKDDRVRTRQYGYPLHESPQHTWIIWAAGLLPILWSSGLCCHVCDKKKIVSPSWSSVYCPRFSNVLEHSYHNMEWIVVSSNSPFQSIQPPWEASCPVPRSRSRQAHVLWLCEEHTPHDMLMWDVCRETWSSNNIMLHGLLN